MVARIGLDVMLSNKKRFKQHEVIHLLIKMINEEQKVTVGDTLDINKNDWIIYEGSE